jgi:hypothetical protein
MIGNTNGYSIEYAGYETEVDLLIQTLTLVRKSTFSLPEISSIFATILVFHQLFTS